MNKYQDDVRAFMVGTDQGAPTTPTLDGYPFELRAKIILEEALEFIQAAGLMGLVRDDRARVEGTVPMALHMESIELNPVGGIRWPEMVDAIVDLLYVTYGAAVSMGVDLDPFWDLVHEANMKKLGGPIRADGKRLKPPGWQPPDVAGLLQKIREGKK